MVTSITSAAGVPTSSTESANVSKHRQPAVLCPSEREHAAQLAINPIHGKLEDGILCELQHRPNRQSQPRKAMPEASTKC